MKKRKQGILLIVLIITIIVIIILVAAVILTLSKNNPIESAREAKFKEDIRGFQDELSLTIAKEYTNAGGQRDEKINVTSYAGIKNYISSFTKEYEEFLEIKNDKLVCNNDEVSENIQTWLRDLSVDTVIGVPREWKNSIASVTEDGVPVPKGFTYVEETLSTGTVIQDSLGNEFVWIPATAENYIKDTTFPGDAVSGDGALPIGFTDESADVVKYGGFYIARYEAGTPDGTESTKTNSEGVPIIQKNVVVWTVINYTNTKKSAEKMISNEYGQTGLITGKAWDRACHWIEDSVDSIASSGSYGNYTDSISPVNVTGYGTMQKSGYGDKWMVKNIYDLAGNAYEWSTEGNSNRYYIRGGAYNYKSRPVSTRNWIFASDTCGFVGFRIRLYIK